MEKSGRFRFRGIAEDGSPVQIDVLAGVPRPIDVFSLFFDASCKGDWIFEDFHSQLDWSKLEVSPHALNLTQANGATRASSFDAARHAPGVHRRRSLGNGWTTRLPADCVVPIGRIALETTDTGATPSRVDRSIKGPMNPAN